MGSCVSQTTSPVALSKARNLAPPDKGAAANCGAVALQNAALQVEKAETDGDLRPVAAKLGELEEEFRNLKTLLEAESSPR